MLSPEPWGRGPYMLSDLLPAGISNKHPTNRDWSGSSSSSMRAMKSVGSCLSIKEKVFHLGRVNSEVQFLGFQC
uniref:Uncharacterized protein n=1 Tax=Picea glauca TaxID=3330 RepID=A0A101M0T9_PICGL|nr:hypothetical protein ABT39_MTgene4235 [Picea glauca]QHR87875.1 hypothetical protein Q903MT_gene1887 [Picea sitchensis]